MRAYRYIQEDPHGRGLRYDTLVGDLGQRTVNQWIGRYTSLLTGLIASGRRLKATSSLIKSGTCAELVSDGVSH